MTTSILAMIGECTGKVRSTPTPKLTLRTVKVSGAAALAADDGALEDLDPLAVALDDAYVHLRGCRRARNRGCRRAAGAVDKIGAVHA